jgi:glutamate synthase (NADPH/NADH) large chain
MGFERQALQRRIALGAQVEIQAIDNEDVAEVQRLLQYYIEALEQTYQYETADHIRLLAEEEAILNRFVKIAPV